MSTVVKCSATTKKGTRCSYKANYGAFCGCHCPKDQVTPVSKKTKALKAPQRSLPKLNATKANQLLEENNILLKAVATNLGINVEEPITKKYNPTYDDEDIKPKEDGEDEELLNWDKKTEEVREITPEVSVEEDPWAMWEGVKMVTPEIMAAWAENEREIEGVEIVTPKIMTFWAEKERKIEEEKEVRLRSLSLLLRRRSQLNLLLFNSL